MPAPKKRYSLFVLGIVLLVIMAVLLVLGTHRPAIRSLGTSLGFSALYLIKKSNVRRVPYTTVDDIEQETQSAEIVGPVTHRAPFVGINDLLVDPRSRKRAARLRWVICVALSLLTLISFVFFSLDVSHGVDDGWPVYAFFGFGFALVLYCGYQAWMYSQR